ncbi:bifunctional diguanylate cyclase/phosphodiesterase [Psychrobacillus sp. INOP01]|uniref:putative bifunctional diguanylate cyclase/phosphodiesterase n=1 Tax=Psychrobacillus sp. INOP01 TaxID=2829187 RepID=UPI001BA97467|nr:bifunctional diguanylate cyclase/phosphodiesterase [Psychrobacillus sp. INOP01]QUG41847.1 bifunctional diguanylate cyclase/phosphodiesterase [Psychrobacillus sp. INOP01]
MTVKKTYRKISFRIVIIYIIISLFWILLSDVLLFRFFPESMFISMMKGIIYISLSALLLLYLMKQSWSVQNDLIAKEYVDDLTGLQNRSSLQKNLTMILQNEERFHLLFIDFDRFKMINDLYGHEIGDIVLKKVSDTLRDNSHIRFSDIISRWVADEFVVVLKNKSDHEVDLFVNSLLAETSAPIHIAGNEIVNHISIGSVHYPEDTTKSSELLRFAEIAAEEAKKNGGLTHVRYRKELSDKANRELYLEEGLKYAIEKQELFLNFQPQIATNTHQIIGVETLIRWVHEEQFISPGEFIPVAEKSGLIIEIGDLVLRETCINIPIIEESLGKELDFSVNVSARQFYQKDYIARTKQIIKETNIDPAKIVLEITESIIMEYTDFVIESLHELRKFGFQIAIDDFGTGYSSFKYLELLPVNIIKIDQSFTQSIEKIRTKAIVQSIISLAHNLDMKILAEGVENLFQVASLREMDCHYLQGYYFSKPLTLDNLIKYYK